MPPRVAVLFVALVSSFAAAAAGARAQIPTGGHVVATRMPGAPATRLVRVDTTTWQQTPMGGFASDTMPPLAVGIDAIDRHVVMALDNGNGTSRVVRLVPIGTVFAELPLVPALPGRVTQLAFTNGDVYAAVDDPNGGLYRLPRRGGTPVLVRAQPNLTALLTYGSMAGMVVMAWTGRPGTAAVDSGVESVEAATGITLFGPDTFANPTGRETTGVVDLPLGPLAAPRVVLSFADGTFGELAGGNLVPFPAQPQPPAGACAAMKPSGMWAAGLVVGNAAHPFVGVIDGFTGAFGTRGVALPGDPVDFAEAIRSGAETIVFAPQCGPVPVDLSLAGSPQPGATLLFEALGPPAQPVILVAGLEDFALGLLPFPLPGGCVLDAWPDAVLWHVLDAAGTARQALPIPPGPQFLDFVLFAQWVHLAPSVSVSNAMAVHVGF